MEFHHAIILALVEGVTEFLPVSSTGHMMMTAAYLKIPSTEFLKTFEIAIQCGAIMAIVVLYWRIFLLDWEKLLKVLAAFIPTALIGFILYKFIKSFLLSNVMVVVWALLIGGLFLIIFEMFQKPQKDNISRIEEITFKQAMIIGLCQSLAVIPGVSRSAATIVGGLMLGINRTTVVEFSFLLAVPTMLAATILDLFKSQAVMGGHQWLLLAVGFSVAFIVALGAVKLLLGYIRRYNFIPFGIYRVCIAIIFMIMLR